VNVDLETALSALAPRRPVFHSERDFQHALAWQIQLAYPQAQIRLETRPRRGVHLDVLVSLDGLRTAIEMKYLVAGLQASVSGELFDLPHQSANDISRHDVIKDITRVEAVLDDGYADFACVLVLSNDRSYWQSPVRPDSIDAAFRLHEGRILAGTLSWAARAAAGTTKGREAPLQLANRYTCCWHDYSRVGLSDSRATVFRYLLIVAGTDPNRAHPPFGTYMKPEFAAADAPHEAPKSLPTSRLADSARKEILVAAHRLASRSSDGSFTLMEILTELRRTGTQYTESTIRTHVTSRMCADSPDHHGTTYDDLERMDRGRYRLRRDRPPGIENPASA
jgi:hypothetical protein